MSERKSVIEILAEAFDQNRSVNFSVKQDSKRKERIRALMQYAYNICKKYGSACLYANNGTACLVNYPHVKKDWGYTLIQEIQLIVKAVGIKKLPQVLERERLIKKHHPNSEFCHLWFIGVKPQFQGKGYGSKMLKSIVEKHEKLEVPIYLETSVEENVAWYEKHGFRVYEELEMTGFITYMLRKQ